jgi:hypothetical protein
MNGHHRDCSRSSSRQRSPRRVDSLEEESDSCTVDHTKADKDFILFKEFVDACREFLGDDMPTVTSQPRPIRVISAFMDAPEEEDYQHLGVSNLVSTAFIQSRKSFFDGEPRSATDQPAFPVVTLESKFGKLPVFRPRYYKTDDL